MYTHKEREREKERKKEREREKQYLASGHDRLAHPRVHPEPRAAPLGG